MLTRRDALKFAALAAANSAPLATITPAEAARLLDEPMGTGPAPRGGPVWNINPDDPVSFAEGFDGIDLPAIADHITAEELADYYHARAGVLQELPILTGVRFDHPWHKMDEWTRRRTRWRAGRGWPASGPEPAMSTCGRR